MKTLSIFNAASLLALICMMALFPLHARAQETSGSAESATGTISPDQIVSPEQQAASLGPDTPLETLPVDPVTVAFLFEHRTALNEKRVTMHGTITATLLADKACPPDRGMCAQARITLGDSRDGAGRTVEVLLPEDDHTPYAEGQVVNIAGTVSTGPGAVIVQKD